MRQGDRIDQPLFSPLYFARRCIRLSSFDSSDTRLRYPGNRNVRGLECGGLWCRHGREISRHVQGYLFGKASSSGSGLVLLALHVIRQEPLLPCQA